MEWDYIKLRLWFTLIYVYLAWCNVKINAWNLILLAWMAAITVLRLLLRGYQINTRRYITNVILRNDIKSLQDKPETYYVHI